MTADRTPAPDALTDATCPCGHRVRFHGARECCAYTCSCQNGSVAALLASPEHAAFVAEQRAEAGREWLRKAAGDLRTNAAPVWGGDSPWLTTGTKVANLTAAWVQEFAEDTEADRTDAEAGRP